MAYHGQLEGMKVQPGANGQSVNSSSESPPPNASLTDTAFDLERSRATSTTSPSRERGKRGGAERGSVGGSEVFRVHILEKQRSKRDVWHWKSVMPAPTRLTHSRDVLMLHLHSSTFKALLGFRKQLILLSRARFYATLQRLFESTIEPMQPRNPLQKK